jgi:hypothetical protein
MGTTIVMVLLIAFLVLMVVVLVLISNPPTDWVEKLGGKRKGQTK